MKPWMLRFLFLPLIAAGCSLTPIPDVTSDWSEPCEETLRRCTPRFAMKAGTEQSVELRGSFRAEGWTKGEPMKREGDSWVAAIEATWGSELQYKFFVNGKTWVLDPANPETKTNGSITNSLIANVTCVKWTCVDR